VLTTTIPGMTEEQLKRFFSLVIGLVHNAKDKEKWK
jgi:hypothetical protein